VRRSRWVTALACLLTSAAGVWGGISLVLLSAQPAAAEGLQLDHVSVISYRGNDNVSAEADLSGWAAPMFYTNPGEGAHPGPPEGRLPTGVWAPGDTWERTLVVRNVDPDFQVRLDGIEVQISGELALADWYSVDVRDAAGRSFFTGSLSEMAAHMVAITQELVLNPGEREAFTFTVHLDINTDQRLQGQTVRADLLIHSSLQGYTLGKVTAGTLRYGSGRKTGGFVIMRSEGDPVPTGELEYQDHGIGLDFHADQYTDLLISLDRTKSWFSGSGRLNGTEGYTFRARAYDFGEPGRTDEFEITIYDSGGNQVYTSGSLLDGGNIQIHK
jgi:hypothetical protein